MRARYLVAAALIALASCGQADTQQAAPANQAAAGAWTPENEQALTRALGEAGRHALDPEDYLRPIRAAGPGGRDAALTEAALAYANALARGRTDPARIRRPYTLPRPEPDLRAGLRQALASGDLAGWLAGLAPQDADYRALSAAYVAANAEIRAAQGQPPPETVERARTLAVNLERRRWLAREAPATRIDVNTASAMLTHWREGAAADTRRVVVGEPGRETPELASPIYRLVANPTWTVPRSIEGEISAGSMARNNMERRDGWIVQRPGPRNSLGLVKFDMQNDNAIYLHDTPAKQLFAQDERHASHGCVRVFDALDFAAMLAAEQGITRQWQEAQARREEGEPAETFVPLPRPIPVRLLYHTAFVENGRVTIVPDAYGWDEDVAEGLGLPRRPHQRAAPRRGDIGP